MGHIEHDSPCPCGSGNDYQSCCRTSQGTWRWDNTPAMDVYCMVDPGQALDRLARQPDVCGEENTWARVEQIPGGVRSLAVITITADGLLIVRTESDEMADQTHGWLNKICGEALLGEDGTVMRVGSVPAGDLSVERVDEPVH